MGRVRIVLAAAMSFVSVATVGGGAAAGGAAGATATTASDEASAPYPAGVVWEGPIEVLGEQQGILTSGTLDPHVRFVHVGDELWVLGWQGNGSFGARSLDGGQHWTEVVFPRQGNDERLTVEHVVPLGDGYLAVASRRSSCHGARADDLQIAVCTRRRPVVFTSPDAVSWTESTPDAWRPPSGSSLGIASIVATDTGYLAAGTIEGPNWRAVLYSSPDGTSWTAEREIGTDSTPFTSIELVHDGTTLTYIAEENNCVTPFDSPGGWVLGSFWARHGRIFTGADIASLTLQQPGEHPLAPVPLEPPPDCGSIDGVPYAAVPYPRLRARLVDGVTTVFEAFVPPEQRALVEEAGADPDADADEVRATAGVRRYAQLLAGTWELTEIDTVSVPEALSFHEYAGRPAFTDVVTVAPSIQHVFSVVDDIQSRSTVHPLLGAAGSSSAGDTGALRMLDNVTSVGDALLLVGAEVADPFVTTSGGTPTRIVVWRSAPGTGSTAPTCELRAGGVCRFFDLTTHSEYPDFSGRDLAGIDLAASTLGSANFDGADLTLARLWMAEGDFGSPPSFVGADLTGARFQRARVGDLSGAIVPFANFHDARITRASGVDFSVSRVTQVRIDDIAGVTFGDADLTGAMLVVADGLPDLAALSYDRLTVRVDPPVGTTVEIDLSGVDLTNLRLEGPLASDDPSRWTVITSMTGAVIDGTTFSEVDLSRVDPAVDLSELRVRTSSTICPDGQPPAGDSFFGSCVRDD